MVEQRYKRFYDIRNEHMIEVEQMARQRYQQQQQEEQKR